MPISTDVNLPKDHQPVWPDRCVCCRTPSPGHRTKVWTFAIGWWTIVLLSFGSIYVTHVPACRACARKMQWHRTLRWVVTTLIASAAAIGAIWVLRYYNGPARVYLGTGIAAVALFPFFMIEVIFPATFDMTCYAKSVDYEFKDEVYAMEFQMLNMHIEEDDQAA